MDYLKPTPLDVELEIRAKVKEIKGRKVIIEELIKANGVTTVRGEIITVQVPDQLMQNLLDEKNKT